MCLILLAWRQHPQFPLIVAANRDEFHARPAERAGFWKDHPEILAGRDLEAQGSWMGVSRTGRFAAVTNYRGGRDPKAAESRGALVTGFLRGDLAPGEYLANLKPSNYSGFNLLLADRDQLWCLSNREGGGRRLEVGLYGLGNYFLDTPEVAEPKNRFFQAINPAPSMEPLFSVLATSKIVAPEYGTRCSTVLIRGNDGIERYAERSFDTVGTDGSTVRYEFHRSG
ncbi:MAG: NRDE family protein [Betaproteobacteria bacterium]|nr:NRDE family protein [Betaproteobacteria bacterium]MSQ89003.1 NRDE family protein [Betaproteobacteria bacterium]